MKKVIGLFMAALMAVSLFGCRVSETTKTRIANVPYSATRRTTRQTTRQTMPAPAPGNPNTTTRKRTTTTTLPNANSSMINRVARGAMPYVAAPVPNQTGMPYNAAAPYSAMPYANPGYSAAR